MITRGLGWVASKITFLGEPLEGILYDEALSGIVEDEDLIGILEDREGLSGILEEEPDA